MSRTGFADGGEFIHALRSALMADLAALARVSCPASGATGIEGIWRTAPCATSSNSAKAACSSSVRLTAFELPQQMPLLRVGAIRGRRRNGRSVVDGCARDAQ